MTMKSRFAQGCTGARGYTLTEVCIVIAIIALVTAVAFSNWATTDEVRDASIVQSAQAALQQAVSQGATRLDVSPNALVATNSANIINAVRMLMQNGTSNVQFNQAGGGFQLLIQPSGRTATYTVDQSGNVTLSALGGTWTQYQNNGGVISKL